VRYGRDALARQNCPEIMQVRQISGGQRPRRWGRTIESGEFPIFPAS
jgi:hypothetical protein